MGVFFLLLFCFLPTFGGWSQWQQKARAVCLQLGVCPHASEHGYMGLSWEHEHVCLYA